MNKWRRFDVTVCLSNKLYVLMLLCVCVCVCVKRRGCQSSREVSGASLHSAS